MKPLILLLASFVIGISLSWLIKSDPHLKFNGNLSMALMFCFTAMGHFKFKKGMTMMLPPSLPFRETTVVISGIAEIGLGIALLFPATRLIAAYALIAMMLLMLPANIYAALNRIDHEKGTYNGNGPSYLWFRIPLQLFWIAWIIWFSIIP
ncbi:MAG: hypothetical protein J7578_02000 [Chitinophagaceae bacterium]|nr:hypothetical protein [Chitinophagaceae bacterium]